MPGPHSRKVTSQIKNRLQWIAYRLCEKTPKNRIKITRLMKYFNDQTELQMRQRLKVRFESCSVGRSLLRYERRRTLWSTTARGQTKASG